jgi:hypothetical protein
VVDPVDPLRHQHGFLLVRHGLRVFPHDVVQPGDHSQALGDLRMHDPVHVVQQIQRFADQLVSVFQVSLLDLVLSRRVEIVGVRRPRIDVLHYGEDVEDVLLVEYQLVLGLEVVVPEQDLGAGLQAEPSQKRYFLQGVRLDGGVDVVGRQFVVEVRFQLLLQLGPERFRGEIRPFVIVVASERVHLAAAFVAFPVIFALKGKERIIRPVGTRFIFVPSSRRSDILQFCQNVAILVQGRATLEIKSDSGN